jgi:flavin reductase (DIM6/NTAB) family NADH-FMN oxidoreductase RutF
MDTPNTTTLEIADLTSWEQRKRAQLINSLGGFKSVCLIGTQNKEHHTNLAIFNSVIHLGANPPLIGFIQRPDTAERHSLANILETGYYTINHLNEQIYRQAHQTSARYPNDISEFDATNLTPEFKNGFFAPFVAQSHVQIGVQFKERINIKLNNTILIIGEIKLLSFPADCLSSDGFLDIEKAQTITCSGLDSYHKTERLSRLSYAKPDSVPTEIEITYSIK